MIAVCAQNVKHRRMLFNCIHRRDYKSLLTTKNGGSARFEERMRYFFLPPTTTIHEKFLLVFWERFVPWEIRCNRCLNQVQRPIKRKRNRNSKNGPTNFIYLLIVWESVIIFEISQWMSENIGFGIVDSDFTKFRLKISLSFGPSGDHMVGHEGGLLHGSSRRYLLLSIVINISELRPLDLF